MLTQCVVATTCPPETFLKGLYCLPSRYNPEHDSESRLLRHRAVALQDMAHSILDHELSEDFERVSSPASSPYSARYGSLPSIHVPTPLVNTSL